MDGTQAQRWLSSARFAPFLRAVDGDPTRAVDVYEWHAELSAACFRTIHHFEVLTRNAIDGCLGEGQPQTPIKDTWLMDFDVLQPNGVRHVITAVERLEKGREITRGRVVAGVSFGFWAGLFSKGYEELWRQRLRAAFPQGAITRRNLTQRMREIQSFRNRVAHHDCLLSQPVAVRVADMQLIAGWIDPDAASWLEERSGVMVLLEQRP